MKTIVATSLALACAAAAIVGSTGCVRKSLAAGPAKDTLGGVREGIELTVYSEEFGMVRETRPCDLTSGENTLQIASVSKSLDPTSILFDWGAQSDGAPRVVANTYDLGMQNPKELLSRYVGQTVDVVRYGQDGRAGDKDTGRLDIASDGGIAIRSGDKYLIGANGTVVAPSRPDIVTIPQLSVRVDSPSAQKALLGVTYLTQGLSWSADYVATMSSGSDALGLQCWATVTNTTGVDFPDAKITLVAGKPNEAVTPLLAAKAIDMDYPAATRHTGIGGGEIAQNGFAAPTEVGELYEFASKDPATIVQGQMNRVRMFHSNAVPTKRDYSLHLPPLGFYGYGNGPAAHANAQLTLSFVNEVESGLGSPLPKGAARIYETDGNGSSRYVGSAEISDTPEGGHVQLTISSVFGVSSDFRVVSTKRIDKRHVEYSVEATIDNRKSRDLDVRVVQDITAPFAIDAADKGRKLTSSQNQWVVRTTAGKSTVLKYRVTMPG